MPSVEVVDILFVCHLPTFNLGLSRENDCQSADQRFAVRIIAGDFRC